MAASLGVYLIVIRRKNQEQRQLRRNLEEALAAAQEANAAKTRFLSSVSHDIRTPLTAIIGLTTIAQDHADDEARVRDSLTKISRSSNHLLGLINDVLDMSKIESGQMMFGRSAFLLSDLIDEVATIIQPQAETKDLTFVVAGGEAAHLRVVGDPMRTSQILINLLSNAVKYTEPSGHVLLNVTPLAPLRTKPSVCGESRNPSNAEVAFRFVVQDDGIGMAEAFLEHLFDPFEREQTATVSGIEGTGLGMSITKSLVDGMGGHIEVESERGRGTSFTVDLPFTLAAEQEEQPGETADSGSVDGFVVAPGNVRATHERRTYEGVRVLLAEDTPIIAEIAQNFIESTGASVDCVANGVEAVARLRQVAAGTYDLIFMDVQMPVMDGLEASRQIIADAQRAGRACPPIIAMTANAYVEDRRLAKEAGMDGYAVKPVDFDTICALFDQHLASDR